jgi:hypothetical protein
MEDPCEHMERESREYSTSVTAATTSSWVYQLASIVHHVLGL